MTVHIQPDPDSNVIEVQASGKLTESDYQTFRPEMERFLEKHGKVRLLFEMDDFHGWDKGAAWEDIKFDADHYSDFEKIAMVGEKRWEKWMATICHPFTTAEIEYFDAGEKAAAERWIRES